MLLSTLMTFSAEYKIIQRSEDGRYYLDEESVLMLANYIAKLEELNKNYSLQITNLEEQLKILKELISIETAEKEAYKAEVEKLKNEIAKLRNVNVVWTVVASIAIGATVILFVVGR